MRDQGQSPERELARVLEQDFSSLRDRERARLTQLIQKFGESFVIFGAGDLGRRTLACLRGIGIEPQSFCDNAPALWGKAVDGLRVAPPDEAVSRWGANGIFIISIINRNAVEKQLEGLGAHFVSFEQLIWHYPALQKDGRIIITADPHKIFEQAPDVKRAMSLWGDDLSRRLYLAQIACSVTFDGGALPPKTPPGEMYLPPDLVAFSPGEVFLDGGAYSGDTVRTIIERRGADFGKILCVEPDPANYEKLAAYIGTLPDPVRKKIVALRTALGSRSGTVCFEASGTVGSKVVSGGACRVATVTVDELAAGGMPTYIKLDIEGSELDALAGARRVITEGLPVLAVCVYHVQEHLWRIPLFVRSLSDRYAFFLRNYSERYDDTVCYAIPGRRLLKPAAT